MGEWSLPRSAVSLKQNWGVSVGLLDGWDILRVECGVFGEVSPLGSVRLDQNSQDTM